MTEDDDGEERAFGRFPADHPADKRARTVRLLKRIADALHDPQATMHGTTNSSVQSEVEPSAHKGGLDDECAALLHAFRSIDDPEERRRLLTLVQVASGGT